MIWVEAMIVLEMSLKEKALKEKLKIGLTYREPFTHGKCSPAPTQKASGCEV